MTINGFAIPREWRRVGIVTLWLMLAAVPAQAHKVMVFAWVEGDTVFTESKFASGRYAKNARLIVYNAAGEKLLEGRSDDRGQWAFKPPAPQTLQIVLQAGSGHRGEWKIAAEEFNPSPGAATPRSVSAEGVRPESDLGHGHPADETVTLSVNEFQMTIEAALEKKLAPIRRRLEQQDQGPALKDIFGGLGYIVGLVGLVAYWRSRRRTG